MTDIYNQSAPGNPPGDTSRKKFQLLDAVHSDLRLSRADICVAHFIINLINAGKGYAWPSQEALVEMTGLSLRTVKRAVARLVRFGILTIQFRGRPGRSNEYVFGKGDSADTLSQAKGDSADTLLVTELCHPFGDTADTPSLTTPVVTTKGVVRTDAGRSPPDGGRARAGEVAPKKAAPDLFEQLWALPWIDKSFKARNAAKRAVVETKARADAPPDDLLVAKAESYLANVPRAEQRWLSVWLRDEGWLCDESPPKPDRASKANGKAAPKPAAIMGGARVRVTDDAQRRAAAEGIRVVGDGEVIMGDYCGQVAVQWPKGNYTYSYEGETSWWDPEDLLVVARAPKANGFRVGTRVRFTDRAIRFWVEQGCRGTDDIGKILELNDDDGTALVDFPHDTAWQEVYQLQIVADQRSGE
jgi:Helix-turn-helix domain